MPTARKRRGQANRSGQIEPRRGSLKKQPQSPASNAQQGANRCGRPFQLPPLSSSRHGLQRGPTGVAASNKPTTCVPQEEKAHADSHTQNGADSRQGCPQRSGEQFGKASNPQTPNGARSYGGEQDFRRQLPVWAQRQRRRFNIQAFARPHRAPTITKPRIARWPE